MSTENADSWRLPHRIQLEKVHLKKDQAEQEGGNTW